MDYHLTPTTFTLNNKNEHSCLNNTNHFINGTLVVGTMVKCLKLVARSQKRRMETFLHIPPPHWDMNSPPCLFTHQSLPSVFFSRKAARSRHPPSLTKTHDCTLTHVQCQKLFSIHVTRQENELCLWQMTQHPFTLVMWRPLGWENGY